MNEFTLKRYEELTELLSEKNAAQKEEIKILNERWESLRVFIEERNADPVNNFEESMIYGRIFKLIKELEGGK